MWDVYDITPVFTLGSESDVMLILEFMNWFSHINRALNLTQRLTPRQAMCKTRGDTPARKDPAPNLEGPPHPRISHIRQLLVTPEYAYGVMW